MMNLNPFQRGATLDAITSVVLVSMTPHLDKSLSHVQFPLSEEVLANDRVQLLVPFS